MSVLANSNRKQYVDSFSKYIHLQQHTAEHLLGFSVTENTLLVQLEFPMTKPIILVPREDDKAFSKIIKAIFT